MLEPATRPAPDAVAAAARRRAADLAAGWPAVGLMSLIVAALIALCQLIAHLRLDVGDDQLFGYFGWRIAHGARVYLDVWDNKPPLIYWTNALGFWISGDSYAGVIALCTLALVIAHAAFYRIARHVYFPGSAVVATILGAFFMTHAYYQGGANRTETFLIAWELAAVTCYVRGWRRNRWYHWAAAGALACTAFLYKQVGLAAFGAMGLHTLLMVPYRRLTAAEALRRCLLIAGGGLVPIALTAGVLAWQGTLGEALFATFTFNRAYVRVGASRFLDLYYNFHMLRYSHILPTLKLPILMAIASVIHATLWRLRPPWRPVEITRRLPVASCPAPVVLFSVWFLAALYGAVISPHQFRHYLIPTLPPLLLLAGYIVHIIQAELSLLRRFAERGWAVAAFVAMGYFALDALQTQFAEASRVWLDREPRWVAGRLVVKPAPWERVASRVVRYSGPRDRIQCWNYWPGIYLHARRTNACRFVTYEKPGQVGDEANFVRQELYHMFQTDPPVLFIIDSAEFERFRLGPDAKYPADWLEQWLATWIPRHYALVEEVTDVNQMIFKRRDLLTTPAP